jgi:hypothetical protein
VLWYEPWLPRPGSIIDHGYPGDIAEDSLMQCFVGKPSGGKEVEEVSAARMYAKNARGAGLDLVQSSYNMARSTFCIVAKGKKALLMWTILSTNTNSSSPDRFHFCRTRDIWRLDTVPKIKEPLPLEPGRRRTRSETRAYVCRSFPPSLRMQISASSPSIVRSERNAIVWSCLGQSRSKLGNSMLVHIDPVQRSPHSLRLATS